MSKIRLTWLDPNFGEEGYNIYRSTSTMNPASLPTALDSVGPDVTSYIDTTVSAGTTYFYRVATVWDGNLYVSDEISLTAQDPYFFDDFESGLTKWTIVLNTGTDLYITDPGFNGSAVLTVRNGTVNQASEDEMYAQIQSPPANYKPTFFSFDFYIETIGFDDLGIIGLYNSSTEVSLGIVMMRDTATSPNRRLIVNNVDTGITLQQGNEYNTVCELDWNAGTVDITISGVGVLSGLSFDNTKFPVDRIRITNQNASGATGKAHFDNISLL